VSIAFSNISSKCRTKVTSLESGKYLVSQFRVSLHLPLYEITVMQQARLPTPVAK
jgi:hypothetical protein